MLLVNRKINRIQKPFNMKLIFIVELTEFTASRPWLLRYLMYLLYVLFGKSLNLWNWYDLTVISNAIIWWNWTHSFQDFIASWKFRFNSLCQKTYLIIIQIKIIATRRAKQTVAIKPKFLRKKFALGRFSKLIVFLTVEITLPESSLKSDLDRLNLTVT